VKFKERLKIFALGAVLGSILVSFIMAQRAQDAKPAVEDPETPEEIQRAAVPGILEAYRQRRAPMQSDFIEASKLYPHPDDRKYRRALILRGVNPEQVLRIEETVIKAPPGEGQDAERIAQVRVMAAGQVVAQLAEGAAPAELAEALRPMGYRLLRRGAQPNELVITLPGQVPESVPNALDAIAQLPQVTTVQPYYLDDQNPAVDAEE